MPIQFVGSKLAKTEALVADSNLKRYVPDTRPFTRQSVKEMLDRLGMVYVKPVIGTFGKGVIRVEKRNRPRLPYVFQSGERKYRYDTFGRMFRKLKAVKRRRRYLVQQGIELLKYAGRRFDLRIMVQKNPRSKWETTGLIGRLAHPRKIVTNYHSGGTPMTVEKLLRAHLPKQQFYEYRRGLEKLGTVVAVALAKKYRRLKEIGIDIAIDGKGQPWILEVNTMPDPYLFRKLPDKSVFRRIYRYAAAYGRFKRKPRRKG